MATVGSVNFVSGFVVWEWLNEHGRWRPYDSTVTSLVENNYGKNPQVFLGSVDKVLQMYILDFSSMCQIRQDSGTARPVRRKVYPLKSAKINEIAWQWSGDAPGSWHTYDFDVAAVLEEAHSRNQTLIDLSSSQLRLPYYINLNAMQQVRIETGTLRSIRRQKLHVPYPLDKGNPQNNVSHNNTHTVSSTSSSSSSSAVPKRMASSSSSDSDDGTLNGYTRHTRLSRRKRKMMKSGQNVSLNVPTPSSSNMSNGLPILFPPTSNSILQSFGSAPGSYSLPTQTNHVSSNSMTSSGANHANIFNVLPPTSTVPTTTLAFQGPLTRSRYSQVSSTSNLVPNNMVTPNPGYLPPSISSMMFPCNLSLGLPSHHQFLPPVSNHANMNSLPLSLSSGKGRGSRISPGVSNITSVLVSPAVPVAFSTHKASAFSTSHQPLEGGISGKLVLTKQRKSKSKTADEVLKKYIKVESKPPDEDCCICYDKLHEESSYGNAETGEQQVISLAKCTHMFHRMCLYAMYDSGHKDGSIQCPTCKTIYGEKYGNCPPGEMEYNSVPHSLPGHPDCNAIRVMYSIHPGHQGPEHPNPGKRYNARGFPRVAYLPDSDRGKKVLKLLMIAWQRRLMFTIGMSTTTGENDTVTWNEIHHKTEFGSNVSGHGYPDPNYLDNVTMELAIQGVTEDDIST